MDPFAITSDTRLYVPRLGSEAALTSLSMGFAAGTLVSVLSGPAGLGKTLLLHVLAERLAGARCVHLPYAALPLEELAHWALATLGQASESGAHAEALAGAARREAAAGRALVLLLDDASAMPLATARGLRALADELAGALRLVAVPVDDGRSSAVIAALGEGVLHVRLRQPLTSDETRHYLRARLARAGQAGSSVRLSEQQIEWLVAESGGVPRVVNALATWLLKPAGEAPGVFEAPGREGLGHADDAPATLEADGDGESPPALPRAEPAGARAARPAPTRAANARMLRRRARRGGRSY